LLACLSKNKKSAGTSRSVRGVTERVAAVGEPGRILISPLQLYGARPLKTHHFAVAEEKM
jgi:hypothetical protein